jgi:hypothetical protein
MISSKLKNSLSCRKWIVVLLTIVLIFLLAGGVTVSAREEASDLVLPDTQVAPVGEEMELGIKAFATVGTQEETSVFILPDTQVVPVDGETEVEVRVSNVSNLYGVEFHLSFEAEMMEVIDADPATDGIQINPGDLLVPGVSANVTSLNQADNVEGTIDLAMTLVTGDEPVSGSGILATIGLSCISQGSTEIIFENPVDGQAPVKLADGDGKPITVTWDGGSISIESSVIPGDADGDGDVDIFDMTKVARIILELDASTPGADADQDSDVDIFDMIKIARIILELD